MIKECKVISNNKFFTTVQFEDKKVQFPAIKRNAKTLRVKYEDGKYSICDDEPASAGKQNETVSENKTKAETVSRKVTPNTTTKQVDIPKQAVKKATDAKNETVSGNNKPSSIQKASKVAESETSDVKETASTSDESK